jgi:hypothetical protein
MGTSLSRPRRVRVVVQKPWLVSLFPCPQVGRGRPLNLQNHRDCMVTLRITFFLLPPLQVSPSQSPPRCSMRLIVRLRQPFNALLLAQHDGEFRRIASDDDIIAQVKDADTVNGMMVVKTLKIRSCIVCFGRNRFVGSFLSRHFLLYVCTQSYYIFQQLSFSFSTATDRKRNGSLEYRTVTQGKR